MNRTELPLRYLDCNTFGSLIQLTLRVCRRSGAHGATIEEFDPHVRWREMSKHVHTEKDRGII